MSVSKIDDGAMSRQLLVTMTIEQQTEWLDGIRTRRLAAVEKHKELVASQNAAKDEKLRARIEKEVGQMQKDLDRLDGMFAKIETRMSKASALIAMQRSET